MFNNFAKFELPAIRGEELWPDAIQSPLIVRASLEYTPNENDPPHADVLTRHFHEIVDNNTPRILNFLTTQRRNYQLGSVDFASTIRTVDALTLHYTNIQGKHEILQLNGQLVPEVYERLQQVSVEQAKFREEEFEELERPEYLKKTEDEEEDQLCVVVFHDGNRVSYAPMAVLNKTTGTATRSRLKESAWGTDIIPTCQVKRGIYLAMSGLTKGTIADSDEYVVTTCELQAETSTDGLISRGEYPIMNCTDGVVWVSSATVRFSKSGKLESNDSLQLETPTGGDKQVTAFAISSSGDRYTFLGQEYLQPYDRFWKFSYVEPDAGAERVASYSASSVEDWASTGVDNSFLVPGEYYVLDIRGTSNTYYHKNKASILTATSGFIAGSGYSVYDGVVLWISQGSGGNTISGHIPLMGHSGNTINITPLNYSTQVSSNTSSVDTLAGGPMINIISTSIINVSRSTIFGPEADSITYTDTIITSSLEGVISPPIPPHYFKSYMPIAFPYAFNGTQYIGVGGAFLDDEYYDYNPAFSEVVTPYGRIPLSRVVYKSYRGWLDVMNEDYVLQGFECDGSRRLYLNSRQITSLLGVPVSSIQTVLFDIPLAKIDQFK